MSKIEPKNFQSDRRSAAEIASSIKASIVLPDRGFKFEQMLGDPFDTFYYDSIAEAAEKIAVDGGTLDEDFTTRKLLTALQVIERGEASGLMSGKPPISDPTLRNLSQALKIIEWQIRGLNNELKFYSEEALKGGEAFPKAYMEDVAEGRNLRAGIKNLEGLKGEFRALASKLNVELIEPEGQNHSGGRGGR